jgi:hypothetical protein
MQPKLKPPGDKHLKLQCDVMLSTSAFKFKLPRYSKAALINTPAFHSLVLIEKMWGWHKFQAGAYTRPLFGST